MEVQAHSKPIERMRLSFDNSHLFSVGQDGCLFIFDVKDRDAQRGLSRREGMMLPFSDEILTEKKEIEQQQQEKDKYEGELNSHSQSDHMEKMMVNKKLDDQISKLEEQRSNIGAQSKNKYDWLNENKREMENQKEEEIKQLQEAFQIDLEEKRNMYSQQMLADAAKFQEKQADREKT